MHEYKGLKDHILKALFLVDLQNLHLHLYIF